mmetsp:Transcript_46056/g.107372  ORF Transcript_46056/g.107372 Transcript_46056/m.107372 type:complete len:225 (+) Transcript_46056:264-938(+)
MLLLPPRLAVPKPGAHLVELSAAPVRALDEARVPPRVERGAAHFGIELDHQLLFAEERVLPRHLELLLCDLQLHLELGDPLHKLLAVRILLLLDVHGLPLGRFLSHVRPLSSGFVDQPPWSCGDTAEAASAMSGCAARGDTAEAATAGGIRTDGTGLSSSSGSRHRRALRARRGLADGSCLYCGQRDPLFVHRPAVLSPRCERGRLCGRRVLSAFRRARRPGKL